MTRVNEGSHTHLPATHTLIHKWNEPWHICLYSPAAERHRTLAGLIFRPTDGRRLSWLGICVSERTTVGGGKEGRKMKRKGWREGA